MATATSEPFVSKVTFILTGQLSPQEHSVLLESEEMLSARLNIGSGKICVVLVFNSGH